MAHRVTALFSALLILGAASAARAQSASDTAPATTATAGASPIMAPMPDPDAARAAPPSEAPAARSERHSIGEALWITGLAVLLPTWALTGAAGTTLVVVANGRTETIVESWIPVIGPWIMLGDSGGFDAIQLVLTTVSGILQTFSTAALIAGLVLVNEGPEEAPRSGVTLLPYATQNGGGITLAGWF